MSLVPLDIMKKGHAKDLLRELTEMIRSYNRSEMKTVMIHADNEFCSVEEEIEGKFDIPFNFANPDEHVADIKRENLVLEERFRTKYHWLPYLLLPIQMIRELLS